MARHFWCRILIPCLALVALALPARAQCFQPDNLDGPCCEQTVVELPQFPTLTVDTKYICWTRCNPQLSGVVRATISPIATQACGYYLGRFTFTNQTGQLTAWSGSLVMAYSRTWAEARNGQTPDLQVWRFIVNGDLAPSADLIALFGNNACVVAPCVPTYGRFHVSGYVDYALDCATGSFSVAYALDHDCDAFEHDNPFSSRPGTFHGTRSYTWVGPAAGFTCSPSVNPADGPASCEAFRDYDFSRPLAEICEYEQPVDPQGTQLLTETEFCPCSTPSQFTQYNVQILSGRTLCGSTASTSSVSNWPGLMTKAIGFWTDPTAYPGEEVLFLERGHFSYTDGCDGVDSRPYMIGVQTNGGFQPFKITPAAPIPSGRSMIDLANLTLPNLGGAPLIGKRGVATKLIYLNIP
jgi:hypothetical protein